MKKFPKVLYVTSRRFGYGGEPYLLASDTVEDAAGKGNIGERTSVPVAVYELKEKLEVTIAANIVTRKVK